jgi:hypothetical protein
MYRRRRMPLLGAAVVVGASRATAKREVDHINQRQLAAQQSQDLSRLESEQKQSEAKYKEDRATWEREKAEAKAREERVAWEREMEKRVSGDKGHGESCNAHPLDGRPEISSDKKRFCSGCGNSYIYGANFCVGCGMKLST